MTIASAALATASRRLGEYQITVATSMTAPNNLRLRQWSRLKYLDPRTVLRELRAVEHSMAGAPLEPRVRTLRTRKLRKHLELRQAALFSFGIGQAIGTPVAFAPSEASDYDFVTRRVESDQVLFTPVQLKETVPQHLNPTTELRAVLEGLRKYAVGEDLVVAIHLNRGGRIDLSGVVVPRVRISEVWLFGSISEGQSRWLLYGNLLRDPRTYEFEYPA